MKKFAFIVAINILLFSVLFFKFASEPSRAENFIEAGCVFVSELRLGSQGAEVKCLQRVLNFDPDTVIASSGPGSKGKETDYFGALTETALKKFQNKISRQLSIPITSITLGVTDKKTRDALNALAGYSSPSSSSSSSSKSSTSTQSFPPTIEPPKVKSITPNKGKSGTTITIKGSGFDRYKNTVFIAFEDPEKYAFTPSLDGTTLEIKYTSSVYEQMQKKIRQFDSSAQARVEDYIPRIIPVAVIVQNERGASEPVFFNLIMHD